MKLGDMFGKDESERLKKTLDREAAKGAAAKKERERQVLLRAGKTIKYEKGRDE